MPSRNQSSCSQLWFCRSRSWGGRNGQADQRVAAADVHGGVHRERHIRGNPAPLSRRANPVRAGASFVGIAFAVLAACPFRGASGKASGGAVDSSLGFRLTFFRFNVLVQVFASCAISATSIGNYSGNSWRSSEAIDGTEKG